LRILHCIDSLAPKVGGPAEGLKRIAQSCRGFGYNVEVACSDEPRADFLRDLPFPVHALGPRVNKYGFTAHLLPWLKRNLRQFDGVVINGVWQYHGYAAWQAARGNLPYFVFTHGMLDPWFKRQYPLKHAKKLAYWSLIEQKVLNDANGVLFTAEAEMALAAENFFGHKWKGIVVPYGALGPAGAPDVYRQQFLAKFPGLRGRRYLLYLGRLHEKKGCDHLLRAFARTTGTDCGLDLVMAGPDADGYGLQLRDIAGQLGIADRIHWTGMLQGDLKWGAFHSSEAFVLPSHGENFGIAVAEALSCGRPVLISDKVNICKEVATDGAGYVDADDESGTHRLLERWMGTNASSRHRMSTAARTCFQRRFNIQNCGRKLLELFSVVRKESATASAA
jgi:glycosyltransferase involved in cell wall biosynthesis